MLSLRIARRTSPRSQGKSNALPFWCHVLSVPMSRNSKSAMVWIVLRSQTYSSETAAKSKRRGEPPRLGNDRSRLLRLRGALPLRRIQDSLAETQVLGSRLDILIGGDVFEGALQAHLQWRFPLD